MEGAGFRDRTPEFTEAGAEILGISFDTPEENRQFGTDQGYPYRLLSDVDKKVGEAYGTMRAPDHDFANFARRASFLIDSDGTVRRIYDVTDVAAHPGEVLDDLRKLRKT